MNRMGMVGDPESVRFVLKRNHRKVRFVSAKMGEALRGALFFWILILEAILYVFSLVLLLPNSCS